MPVPEGFYIWGAHGDDTQFFQRGLPNSFEPIIGKNVCLGWGAIVDCLGQVIIGDDVFFGHQVKVLTGTHDYTKFGQDRQLNGIYSKPVTIEEGVWICTGAIICPGVTIGKHSVVAAGSVVVKNVAPYTLVGGNPAEFIKEIPH
jgi:acetyltransferase-like isoleucine patch superfamily enzyme